MRFPLLRRPDPMPTLDEFWEPPPRFEQAQKRRLWHGQNADGDPLREEPGLNAQWRVDLCLYKRKGFSMPALLAYTWARVRHSTLSIGDANGILLHGTTISVPLVEISLIELDILDRRSKKRGIRHGCAGQMQIRGRHLFTMLMFITAESADDLFAIRDWLRFLVVRQRIPHLVLGLRFAWANNGDNEKGCQRVRTVLAKFGRLIRLSREQFRTFLTNFD